MTQRFGNRSTFAIEVGESLPPSLRVIDLWAAGKRLTAYDNVANVLNLRQFLRSVAAQVRAHEIRPCLIQKCSPEEIFRRLQADETDFREQAGASWPEFHPANSRPLWTKRLNC